jgi:hypothetical protein
MSTHPRRLAVAADAGATITNVGPEHCTKRARRHSGLFFLCNASRPDQQRSRGHPDYTLPIRSRIRMITTTSPNPLDG